MPRTRPARWLTRIFVGSCTASVLACMQFKLIDEAAMCDEVAYALSARVHECSGDAGLATQRFEAFRAATTCRTGWYETYDQVPDGYSCATTISALSCAEVEELGSDWEAWLAVDPQCDLVVGVGPAEASDGADGTGDGADGTADGADGTADGADGTADGADGTADGADGTADGSDGTDPTITYAGTVFRYGSDDPFAAAEVCLWDNAAADFAGCVTADAAGAFAYTGLDPDQTRYFYLRGYDTLGTWLEVELGADDIDTRFGSFRSTTLNAAASELGITPTGPSFGVVQVVDDAGAPVADATISLSPTPEQQVLYLADDGSWDSALTATSSHGVAILINIVNQEYAVSVAHATRACAVQAPWVDRLWPASGYTHLISVECVE